MPSKESYVQGFHQLVCKEIGKAIQELREDGIKAYPPEKITYTMDGEEFSYLVLIRRDNNARHTEP